MDAVNVLRIAMASDGLQSSGASLSAEFTGIFDSEMHNQTTKQVKIWKWPSTVQTKIDNEGIQDMTLSTRAQSISTF